MATHRYNPEKWSKAQRDKSTFLLYGYRNLMRSSFLIYQNSSILIDVLAIPEHNFFSVPLCHCSRKEYATWLLKEQRLSRDTAKGATLVMVKEPASATTRTVTFGIFVPARQMQKLLPVIPEQGQSVKSASGACVILSSLYGNVT